MISKALNHTDPGKVGFKQQLEPYRGILHSVQAMVYLASLGQSNPIIRDYAVRIIRRVYPKDYLSELAAIYYEVCRTQRYTRDPANHEFVQHPVVALKSRATDCDDQATLLRSIICSLAAAAKATGNETQFMTVGFDRNAQKNNMFTHVFLRVYYPKLNQYLVLDPVAGPTTREMISKIRFARAYKER